MRDKSARVVILFAALATLLEVALVVGLANPASLKPAGWLRVARVALPLPYLAVLAATFAASPRACGLAAMAAGVIGLAGFGVLAIAGAWQLGLRAAFSMGVFLFSAMVIPAVGVLLAQLALLRAGQALRVAEPFPHARAATLLFAALSTLAGLQFVQSVKVARTVPQPFPLRPPTPSEVAHGSLNLTLPCLARYAHARGEYPDTLAALGPRGNGCLPEEYTAERVPGYAVRYEPRTSTNGGRRDRFGLRYEPMDASQRAYALFQTDETGLVYRGVDTDGHLKYPIEGQAGTLGALQGCVEYFRLLSGTDRYPRHLEETSPKRPSTCLEQYRMAPESDAPNLAGRLNGYRFQYAPGAPDATGKISTYQIAARPLVYGRPYTRSYLCDPTGRLHATDEDRPAQSTDANPNVDKALGEELPGPCRSSSAYAEQHRKYSLTNSKLR